LQVLRYGAGTCWQMSRRLCKTAWKGVLFCANGRIKQPALPGSLEFTRMNEE